MRAFFIIAIFTAMGLTLILASVPPVIEPLFNFAGMAIGLSLIAFAVVEAWPLIRARFKRKGVTE